MSSSSFSSFCGSFTAPILESLRQYQTAKIVQLKDQRLGLLYYGLVLAIVFFVVGYEILYCNDHFDKRDVSGTPLMNIQQPTRDSCNPSHEGCLSDFTPLTELPYCKAYRGNSTLTKVPPEDRANCVYEDHHTLVPNPSSGRIFIPTRVDWREEVLDCYPSAENNFTCWNEYKIVNQTPIHYVADIERYTLLIAHTYQRDAISGNNNLLEGSYLECDRRHRASRIIETATRLLFGREECPGGYWRREIPCIAGDCDSRSHKQDKSLLQELVSDRQGEAEAPRARRPKAGRGSRRMALKRERLAALQVDEARAAPKRSLGGPPPADPAEAYAIPDGDVFSLAKLLQLAGVSLDATTNLDDEPLRKEGMMLDIEVKYNNLHAFKSTFGDTQVEYWYTVAMRPLHQVKEELVEWTDEGRKRRTIQNRHGIEVVVKVQGTFGFFSIMNLMLMLTTASAMLAVATVMTDKLAIYAMADKDFYAGKKYEIADAHQDEESGPEQPKQGTSVDRT